MRFKRHLKLEQGFTQIEITPLINMVLLLLSFFLLTSNFAALPGIKINLPKVATSQTLPYESTEIVIDSKNVIHLNGKTATMEDLKEIIRQISKRKQSILIKTDARVSVGRVVEVWNICRDLGIIQINITTN